MRVLWISEIPLEVGLELCPETVRRFPTRPMSWITAHLPPPPGIELHIASPVFGLRGRLTKQWRGATFHLFPHYRYEAAFAFVRWLPDLTSIRNRLRPNVIHGWGTESGFGLSSVRLGGGTSVLSIQGVLAEYLKLSASQTLAQRLMMRRERRTVHEALTIHCESHYSAELVKKHYSRSSIVVPHPLRQEFLSGPLANERLPSVVFVGTFCTRKGIVDALQAFEQVANPAWSFLIVGHGAPIDTGIATLRRSADRIRYLGSLPAAALAGLLASSSIFLLPSLADTGPTALKEAISMGLWPICYDNSGPQEILTRYSIGARVPTSDRFALAEALSRAMDQGPKQLATECAAAARQIRQHLSREAVWSELKAMYVHAGLE